VVCSLYDSRKKSDIYASLRSFKIGSVSTEREYKGYFQSFLCTCLTKVVTYDPCDFFLIFTADPYVLFTTIICETAVLQGRPVQRLAILSACGYEVVAAVWVFCRKEVYCKVVTK